MKRPASRRLRGKMARRAAASAAADPARWRAPPQKRDWIEYAGIALALVAAGYFFG